MHRTTSSRSVIKMGQMDRHVDGKEKKLVKRSVSYATNYSGPSGSSGGPGASSAKKNSSISTHSHSATTDEKDSRRNWQLRNTFPCSYVSPPAGHVGGGGVGGAGVAGDVLTAGSHGSHSSGTASSPNPATKNGANTGKNSVTTAKYSPTNSSGSGHGGSNGGIHGPEHAHMSFGHSSSPSHSPYTGHSYMRSGGGVVGSSPGKGGNGGRVGYGGGKIDEQKGLLSSHKTKSHANCSYGAVCVDDESPTDVAQDDVTPSGQNTSDDVIAAGRHPAHTDSPSNGSSRQVNQKHSPSNIISPNQVTSPDQIYSPLSARTEITEFPEMTDNTDNSDNLENNESDEYGYLHGTNDKKGTFDSYETGAQGYRIIKNISLLNFDDLTV